MRDRIKNTLHAPDMMRRITHFVIAKVLWAIPASARRRLFAGEQHYCPICQSHVRVFLSLHRVYHKWCPVCRSLQRHRLVWLFLQQRTDLFQPVPRTLLHFAPEPAFTEKFRELDHIRYVSADRYDPAAMVKLDLCDLPARTAAVDIVFCSHVLEHVPDDRQAIGELHRVLNDQGWAIILVPIFGEISFEDPSITDPVERERVYGQHDHVRLYGKDFSERLEQGGFVVTPVTTEAFTSPADLERFGIEAGETIFFCRK